MKSLTITVLSILLGSSPAFAVPVIYKDDIVKFNPYIVCDDLIKITDDSSYEDWREYQHCVKYLKSVDGVY